MIGNRNTGKTENGKNWKNRENSESFKPMWIKSTQITEKNTKNYE